ncbi:PAS domain S-box protein [Halobaculum sp. MBLA0143]|uniref:PAS domain S-box protein n=1 Tax=Halobaculum sp. MBLA0143 TaxID=3079933 RepID=UPI00352600A7
MTFGPAAYERAFESAGIPVLLMDPQGTIRDVNDAGLSFAGYDREELVGTTGDTILAQRATVTEITEAMAAGNTWQGDLELRTADGRTVYGQGSVAPIRTGDDEAPPGYVAAFVDARQKRQYETAAEVLNRLLRHDLKNDLNVVYGYIQQARRETDDPAARTALTDARETLSRVIDKSERARDLRKLLDRAYQESTYPVRLDVVLSRVVADVSATYEEATFELGDLPTVSVVADDLLATVLEGVVENAVEHNDGDPHVGVDVETNDRTAVVRVADDGPGMSQGGDVVFGRGATDALNHGDGISLFFADSVVRTYEGQLWFEEWEASTPPLSAESGGTVFKLELLLAGGGE